MDTTVTPTESQLSEAAEYRNVIYRSNVHMLREIAHEAIHVHKRKCDEFVLFSILVDSMWRSFVDMLIPNHDWQPTRDQKMDPVANCAVSSEMMELLAASHPTIAHILLEKPDRNIVKVVVLSNGGCTVYKLDVISELH